MLKISLIILLIALALFVALPPSSAAPIALPPRATFTPIPPTARPDPDATPAPTDPPSTYPYPAPAHHRHETLREALEDFFGSR